MNDDPDYTEVVPEVKPRKRNGKALVVPEEPGWLGVINKMIDKGLGADLLAKVFELQQKAEAENQRKEFVAAFTAFKAEAPSAIKRTGHVGYERKAGGQTAYDHVELDVATAELTPILSKHGLAHSWESNQGENGLITISCRLEHTAGHARTVTLRALPDPSGSKNHIQAIGSTIYYLERYTFLAVLGIAQAGTDNDAADQSDTLIREEQDDVERLLAETQADRAKFLKWASVDEVSKILRRDFRKVMDMLQRRGRKGNGNANN